MRHIWRHRRILPIDHILLPLRLFKWSLQLSTDSNPDPGALLRRRHMQRLRNVINVLWRLRPASADFQQLLHESLYLHRHDYLRLRRYPDEQPLRLMGILPLGLRLRKQCLLVLFGQHGMHREPLMQVVLL